MPEKTMTEILGSYTNDDYTAKICGAIFGVVPGLPPYVFYNTIDGAAQRLGADDAALERAKGIADTPDVKKALWVVDALDKADMGLSVMTGVQSILSIFGGSRQQHTLEADPQQALDAALKAAGLSYIIYKVFPGDVKEKIRLYRELPAGLELGVYYAAAEVALPFADNLVEGGAALLGRLFSSRGNDMNSRFSSVVGADALAESGQVMQQFTGPLGEYVDMTKGHTGSIMGSVRNFLPSAATIGNIADSATGAVATAMDVMPVWKFLGGRVVAEACVSRAMKGV